MGNTFQEQIDRNNIRIRELQEINMQLEKLVSDKRELITSDDHNFG